MSKTHQLLQRLKAEGLQVRGKFAPGDSASEETLRLLNSKGPMRRAATVGEINVDARTVDLSFSSEAEYERWWGIEILDHSPGAMRMGRLQDGAPLLFNHDWDNQLGVIDSVSLGGDRMGRAKVRFGRGAVPSEKFQDVRDGILTKVSVGYLIHEAKLVEERDGVEVWRITDWEPFEVSMVTVPADNTVGVGRSAENPQEENPRGATHNPSNVITPTQQRTDRTMKEKYLRDASGNLVRAKVDDEGKIVEVLEVIEEAGTESRSAQARGADTERARVRAITEMGAKFKNTELALKFISEGKSPEDFQRALLDEFDKRTAQPLAEQTERAAVGLTDKEVRQFSFLRAARALQRNATKEDIEAAGFERECSQAAEKAYGKTAKGFLVPAEVLSRAFSTTTPAAGAGSNIVATDLLAGSFVEMLRKRAWVMRRATVLGGLVGNVDIPRQTGGVQAYWVGEGGAPTTSDPTLDQITFSPKTVGAWTDITRRLLLQSSPDAEGIVRSSIVKDLALELDRVCIYGSGSQYQPLGVKNYNGINAVDFATAGKPSFPELVDMETQIALDNADVDSMAYAFNAAVRGHAKTTVKFASAGSATIWEPGSTVNGYAAEVSNQIATGDVFFGNWADLIVAMWGGLDLTADPYALSTSGGLRLIALQDIDANLRRVESFCYGSDTVA